MINPILTIAISDFHAAEAAIPSTAQDAVMDAATSRAAAALDRVCRIPAFTEEDVAAKLELASALVEWDVLHDRLIAKASDERAIIECNARLRQAA